MKSSPGGLIMDDKEANAFRGVSTSPIVHRRYAKARGSDLRTKITSWRCTVQEGLKLLIIVAEDLKMSSRGSTPPRTCRKLSLVGLFGGRNETDRRFPHMQVVCELVMLLGG